MIRRAACTEGNSHSVAIIALTEGDVSTERSLAGENLWGCAFVLRELTRVIHRCQIIWLYAVYIYSFISPQNGSKKNRTEIGLN